VWLCQFFCCGGKANLVRIFLLNPRKFLLIFLALYGSTTIESRLFLKNVENFVWFPKQYLLGFFILEKQLANIPDRGFLFLCNTLLLYSLSPYWRTERWTESQIHSLRVGWRNLFPVVLLSRVSFWFWREIGFGLHTHVLNNSLAKICFGRKKLRLEKKVQSSGQTIMRTPAITRWFPKQYLFGFFILEKQLAS
jgi:hypothetical protein